MLTGLFIGLSRHGVGDPVVGNFKILARLGFIGGSNGVNWTQILKQFASLLATLFVIGLAVAAVSARGIYTPSKIQGKEVTMCEDRVTNLTTQVYKDFNSSLQSYRPVAAQGLLVNLPNTTWNELNATVAVNAKDAKNLIDQMQWIHPRCALQVTVSGSK